MSHRPAEGGATPLDLAGVRIDQRVSRSIELCETGVTTGLEYFFIGNTSQLRRIRRYPHSFQPPRVEKPSGHSILQSRNCHPAADDSTL
jgi:hypothetical protein